MEDRGGFFFRVGREDTLMHDIMSHFQQQGRGKLSRAIRDGLRLFWDLSHQRTDVLIELFPFVTEAICPKTPDNDDMERRIADMVAKQLEGKLQHRNTSSIPDTRDYGIPAMKQAGQGIGKLSSISLAMPTFDDDDQDTLQMTIATGKLNGGNLLDSINGVL